MALLSSDRFRDSAPSSRGLRLSAPPRTWLRRQWRMLDRRAVAPRRQTVAPEWPWLVPDHPHSAASANSRWLAALNPVPGATGLATAALVGSGFQSAFVAPALGRARSEDPAESRQAAQTLLDVFSLGGKLIAPATLRLAQRLL